MRLMSTAPLTGTAHTLFRVKLQVCHIKQKALIPHVRHSFSITSANNIKCPIRLNDLSTLPQVRYGKGPVLKTDQNLLNSLE